MDNDKLYSNQIQLTSQFRFCGNAFRVDTYRGCDFGCKYCFANNRQGKGFGGEVNYQLGDQGTIEAYFKKINNGLEYADINVECLRERVPLHLGGMSDPFQTREWKHGLTYKFLELSNKYRYPVVISTKAAHLPDKYFEVLDPDIHAFQISLINYDNEHLSRLETNTPKPLERIAFIKLLKSKGFWVSVRIQPLVDIEQAIKILNALDGFIDYCTVEHLKLPKMNNTVWSEILDCIDFEYKKNMRPTKDKPEFELNNFIKLNNIKKLKELFKGIRFGCGDNDLHEHSDSFNCCGVDTMPGAFNNWLKYNSMYLKMTSDDNVWYPKKSCSGCFNSGSIIKGFTFKDYVDRYFTKKYGDTNQGKLF